MSLCDTEWQAPTPSNNCGHPATYDPAGGDWSGRAGVLVDEAVEALAPDDRPSIRGRQRNRRPELQTPMRPGVVVVDEILAEDRQQVALIEDDQPVQRLSHPGGVRVGGAVGEDGRGASRSP